MSHSFMNVPRRRRLLCNDRCFCLGGRCVQRERDVFAAVVMLQVNATPLETELSGVCVAYLARGPLVLMEVGGFLMIYIALPIELSLFFCNQTMEFFFLMNYKSDIAMGIPLKADTDLCPPLGHDLLRHYLLPFVACLVLHNISANTLAGRKAHYLRQGVLRYEGMCVCV